MNNAIPTITAAVTRLEQNLIAMQASRERLQRAKQAVASGQFAAAPGAATTHTATEDAPPDAATAARLQGRANAMDATFELMQQRVMGDISGAMQRLDGLARFNSDMARATAPASWATPRHSATTAAVASATTQADVIDVEAKDISARTAAP